MATSLLRSIRGHGRSRPAVVVVLVALAFLAWPTGAVCSPVAPVPVGVWPLQPTPRVVRGFEPPGSAWGAGHRGVDLAGSPGQVVHTALAGRVVFAARLAGRGVVVVDHGSTRTTYEPVDAAVLVGDILARGQPLGTLELAGSHCRPGACLHWGWKRGTTYLDPLLLIGGGPIVLLPLWGEPWPGTGPRPAQPYAEVVARLLRGCPRCTTARDSPRRVAERSRGDLSAGAPVWQRPLARRPLLL
jgi:hypothetical protein